VEHYGRATLEDPHLKGWFKKTIYITFGKSGSKNTKHITFGKSGSKKPHYITFW
jgi:hypothetical protein